MLLAPPFQDHAVLQRNRSIPVWGVAEPHVAVNVTLGESRAFVMSGPDGRWLVRLPAMPAGGPYTLTVQTPTAETSIHDVLVGEVWVCSGQSNMEWKLSVSEPFDETATAPMPQVRLLTLTTVARLGHQTQIDGKWAPATAKTLADFSAVGAWFGRQLHAELGVPIGLIGIAWGGTRIQAWMSREALVQDPQGLAEITSYEEALFALRDGGAEIFTCLADWEKRGAPKDLGNRGLEEGWAALDFPAETWPTMSVPSRWQDYGHPGSGIFWFRRTVTVPAEWIGRDLEVCIGAVDKHDDTYVNGERVGGLSWDDGPNTWCTERTYPVPAHLVGVDGRIAVSVRARSHIFHGGLIGPGKKMGITLAGDATSDLVPLAGDWAYSIEQDWGMVESPATVWGPNNANSPHILFDSRVNPLLPYAIQGVIWYQGESNAAEPANYARLMPAMIRDWRRVWGQGNFPFLQVQLANYMPVDRGHRRSDWAELREAQVAALAEPNTGIAVAIDVGDALDIHPKDKRTVGQRLARWALAETYGRGGIASSPLYKGATFEAGGRIRVHFHHAAGLRTRDGLAPDWVSIAGRDKKFVWAQATVEGETLVVWNPEISSPQAVRYAWANNPTGCNLVNGEDLPVSPFRTDAW